MDNIQGDNVINSRLQKWLLTLFIGIVLIGVLLFLFVWGPWSPEQRARSRTLASTQELHEILPFTIIDQVSKEYVNVYDCRVNHVTLRIGSSLSLTESVSLFTNTVRKIGWTLQPEDYAGVIYYFERSPNEVLAVYTENIGPREWLQPPDSGNHVSFLYVQVASGATYVGLCEHL
jgi:hypothetical protein